MASKFLDRMEAQRVKRDDLRKDSVELSEFRRETVTALQATAASEDPEQKRLAALFQAVNDNPCAQTLSMINKSNQTQEIIQKAVEKDGLALKHASKPMITYDLCQKAVLQNGLALKFVPAKFLSDEIIEFAVRTNGFAIAYVPPNRITRKLARLAIRRPLEKEKNATYDYPLGYVPEEIIDEQVARESVLISPCSLQYVPKKFFSELIYKAVEGDGNALQFVPEHRKGALAGVAISSNPFSLRYVPWSYRSQALCETAFRKNPLVLRWIPEQYISAEMCITAIESSDSEKRFDFSWVPEKYLTDKRIIDALLLKLGASQILKLNEIRMRTSYSDQNRKTLPSSTVSYIQKVAADDYQNIPFVIQWLPEFLISKEMCLAAIKESDSQDRNKIFMIDWIPESLRSEKEILDALIEKYGEDRISSWNNGLLMRYTVPFPTIQIEEAVIPPPTTDVFPVPIKQNYVYQHDTTIDENGSPLKVYYISDLHIEHQLSELLRKETVTYPEVYEAVDNKINEMLRGIEFDTTTGYLLIGGDVGHTKELVSLFYDRLRRYWKRSIISILGNHELWDDHPEGIDGGYCSRPVEEIIDNYRKRINYSRWNYTEWGYGTFLLQNALFINDKNEQKRVIEEPQLESIAEEELRKLCFHSSFIVLGGIGFSGLNKDFNASKKIYRSAVTQLEKDVELSKKFECIYEKLLRCARDKQVIVLTHTPVSDWLSSEVNPNWVYINGHTHRNSIVRNSDGTTILSDNQIGYTPKKWKLNLFTVSGEYDPFINWENGSYEITSAQYLEFNHARGISINGCNYPGTIHMLKHEKLYMFILQSKSGLCLLVGGQRKRLERKDIQYYFDHMVVFAKKIMEATQSYQNALKEISKKVQKFGGLGTIHGCIVDIDWFNHIYLNPHDGKITPYYSARFGEQKPYNDLLLLLKEHSPNLCAKYMETYGDSSLLGGNIENKSKTGMLTTDSNIIRGTEIYKPSRIIRSIQYLFEKNVIRIWDDKILSLDQSADDSTLQIMSSISVDEEQ